MVFCLTVLNGTVNLTNNLIGPELSYHWFCTTNKLRDVSEIETTIDDGHPFGNKPSAFKARC